MDGLSVLKALRAAQNPRRSSSSPRSRMLDERVTGLRAGADDYLTKPFSFLRAARARSTSVLRSAQRPRRRRRRFNCGDLSSTACAAASRAPAARSTCMQREFQMLEFLMRHKDRVVTRTMLLERSGIIASIPTPTHRHPHQPPAQARSTATSPKPLLHTSQYRLPALAEQPADALARAVRFCSRADCGQRRVRASSRLAPVAVVARRRQRPALISGRDAIPPRPTRLYAELRREEASRPGARNSRATRASPANTTSIAVADGAAHLSPAI